MSKRLETGSLEGLPIFIFVDEYPELNGHQNIAQFLQRKSNNTLSEAEKNFEKLCKVAGIDPAQLHSLQGEGKYEERNLIANRASGLSPVPKTPS